MSIALEVRVRELEQRVNSLELTLKNFATNSAPKEEPGSFEKLMGEIKAIKMRMGKRDS